MKDLIKKYGLAPHPEGGYFREIYRSDICLESPATKTMRNAATHIYFLLAKGQVSRFHRVIHDELWHFYQGAPLRLIQYDGSKIKEEVIGPEAAYMSVVPGNVWQAAESAGEYSLVGCTVAPGFDFEDFSFLSDAPEDLARFTAEQDEFKRFI